MKPLVVLSIVVGVVLLIVLAASTYVVREWEQVILTQFGRPVGEPVTEAGLHFKLPFVQDVQRFEKRILIWDGERNQIPTADKRYIWVDTTARWRIHDPLKFLQAVRTEAGAQAALDNYLNAATRDVISSHKLIEVVRVTNRILDLPAEELGGSQLDAEARERIETGRNKITERIFEERRGAIQQELGIELIDVRIKRVNYVESVRREVYSRMISERQRIAEQYRSEGRGRKAEIDGKRAADEKEISSDAYREAQELVATADAEAARIFADAYSLDPEFYSFVRTLEAYEKSVGDNHTLVVAPDSELYRYLAGSNGE